MILIIDNYDSFVENLARYCRELGVTTHVVRNNAITVSEVLSLAPTHIILSPGPKTPNEAGICLSLLAHAPKIPTLGVCLGHQALGQAFGGSVIQSKRPLHGQASRVSHANTGLFQGLPNPLTVGRYHSLSVELSATSPLIVDAVSEEGEVMALRHPDYPLFGVQFHPESILTPEGKSLLDRFLIHRPS